MFSNTRQLFLFIKRLIIFPSTSSPRFYAWSPIKSQENEDSSERGLMHIEAQFRRIPEEDRNKKTFHAAIGNREKIFIEGRIQKKFSEWAEV